MKKYQLKNGILSQQEHLLNLDNFEINYMKKNFFIDDKFDMLSASNYYNCSYDILRKLQLEKRGIHQTRHTFASNMLSNMENPLWVSQMLGHKSLNMTLEIYTRYIKEEKAPIRISGHSPAEWRYCHRQMRH